MEKQRLINLRKGTPETAAKTKAEYAHQLLRLQEAILLEQKVRIDAAKAYTPPTPAQQNVPLPEGPYNPNKLMKDDQIPF